MSIHPSFKSNKGKQQNSVLKRLDRILQLKKQEKWDEEKNSVFGLPKVKVTKLKFKKEKKEAAEGDAAATAAGAPAQPAPGGAAAKPQAGKSQDTKKK